ncbi:hypothetical protein EXU57_03920 [Segetibacter sp. 3557_3]|uniref:hypothetical protein n=1 Tax=Segetibacter sp. 3557_3 TaxID=2547429 RepID=UPI00105875C2|nr:hypothetical protein [Segetibacter sp. 3557_3]TDH29224.1 hypothetical protein EXU57_03920 [Segetibacter sp. 3557_3]
MIKLNELRLGNLITWNPALVNPKITLTALMVEIAEIRIDTIGYGSSRMEHRVEPFEDDLIQLEPIFKSLEEFEPVKLSAKLLEAAGFQKHKQGWVKALIELGGEDHEFVISLAGKKLPVEKITTLHQLQNIYFALFGYELDFVA